MGTIPQSCVYSASTVVQVNSSYGQPSLSDKLSLLAYPACAGVPPKPAIGSELSALFHNALIPLLSDAEATSEPLKAEDLNDEMPGLMAPNASVLMLISGGTSAKVERL
jgi:hypothetical protein